MSTAKALNAENRPMLATYLVANVIVYALIIPQVSDDPSLVQIDLTWLTGILAPTVVGSLFATILNLLTPEGLKHVLVFWRLRDVLPGHRAFSVWANKDSRFQVSQLKAKITPWPSTTKAENAEWYRLLKAHEALPFVRDAHQQFLLARDLTAMTPVLLIAFVASRFVMGSPLSKASWIGYIFAIVEFVIVALAGRFAGNRRCV